MQDLKVYDTIVIGAGPAGLTSAIYLLRARKQVLILEKSSVGGGIASTPAIENYPGYQLISGEQLADHMYNQVMNLGGELEVWEAQKIEENGFDGSGKLVWKISTDGPDFYARSIIIATGNTYRKTGLPREEEFIGHGISFCVTCDGAFFKDQVVAVLGGGNSGVTNALELSEIAKEVIVLQDLEDLTCEKVLKEKLLDKKNVKVFYNTKIKEFLGDTDLNGIKLLVNGKEEEIKVDGLFISIGLIPATNFLRGFIDLNERNYVASGENCNTNKQGIFVAGDVRNKAYRQITTANSDGTIAALETEKYLKN